MAKFSIGLDYGTNSVRAVLVEVATGKEVATSVWSYAHGRKGIILSDKNPNLARQHPADYLKGAQMTIRKVLAMASKTIRGFDPKQIIGIGVDGTASTPIPVDRTGRPLAMDDRFAEELDAMAWLWKDHTAVAEAEEITALARKMRPEYLAKCGGIYSSEWFFSKILHCCRTNPKVYDASYLWVEMADWISAVLTGTTSPDQLKIGICAAGHKAMYHEDWGGYPDAKFLGKLHYKLSELRTRLRRTAKAVGEPIGTLTKVWATKLGLHETVAVSIGAIDAHIGAVGAGISPGTLVKIIGTSTCDMMIVPFKQKLPDIPGLCGIVPGSVVPGFYGLEAGQSAVGDLFNWLVDYLQPTGKKTGSHESLTTQAAMLKPGASGLLALDWNNGNRTILVDQRLTGLMIGQTLYTTPAEIYRALIEATAFGALTIINRLEEYGVKVRQIVNCGGIAEKSPLVMQIYADVTGRPMKISCSSQTCALGSAIAGAVAAGKKAGGYDSIPAAQKKMTGLKSTVYYPNSGAHDVYKRLYAIYRRLHDAFGTPTWKGNLYPVMKELLAIRNQAR